MSIKIKIILLVMGLNTVVYCLANERKHPLDSLDFHKIDAVKPKHRSLEFLEVYDPVEPVNRLLYKFNRQFDETVYLPVVAGYEYILPVFIRKRVSNVFNNVAEVSNIVNNSLQFKLKDAFSSTGRLLLNTTVGIFGLFDPASYLGIEQQREDFGQTLTFYGIGNGAYVVLPILGPSNIKDTARLVVDSLLLNYANWLNIPHFTSKHWEAFALKNVDQRYQISFRYGSLDSPFEYDMVRYLYKQSRQLKRETEKLSDKNES